MVAKATDLPRSLHALEDGVVRLERNIVVAVNDGMARLTGLVADDLIGREITEIFADPEGRPLRILETSDAVRVRNAGGELVPVAARELDDGLVLVLDRVRERRLEREVWRLTQAQRQSPTAGSALVTEEFESWIEHEISTASTAVRGYLRLLIDGKAGALTDEQRGFMLEARRANDRTLTLLADLLALSAPDAESGFRIVRKPVRFHDILDAGLAACRPFFEERSVTTRVLRDLVDPTLYADPDRIEQVLVNLLTNAAKFTSYGSEIEIEISQLEVDDVDDLVVTIRDHGPGVSAEEAEEIFDAFVRGDAARQSGSDGSGLGLAVARRISDAHGGSLQAITGTDRGEFRLRLPLAHRGKMDG